MSNKRENIKICIYSTLDLTSSDNLNLENSKLSDREHVAQSKEKLLTLDGKRLLEFIADYDDGFFLPEKCDEYEPIKKVFDRNDLSHPIQWLSKVWGQVHLKKKKPFKYEGFLDKIPMHSRPDPIFLTEWCFWIDKKILKLKSLEYVKRFFIDLYIITQAGYGFMTSEADPFPKNYLVKKTVGDKTKHCPLYWGNIFGKMYVEKMKFDTMPCYEKEELPDGSMFVQCAKSLTFYNDPDGKDVG